MNPLVFDVIWVAGAFVIAVRILRRCCCPCCSALSSVNTPTKTRRRAIRRRPGTPTMGGIVFVLVLVPVFALRDLTLVEELFFLVAACAAIGFIDDLLSIRSGTNRGLSARTKFLASILVAITFLRWTDQSYALFPRDVLFHSGSYAMIVPHWLWLTLGMLAIAGTIHAVNLTDGLGRPGCRIDDPAAGRLCIDLCGHGPCGADRRGAFRHRRLCRISGVQPASGEDVHGRYGLARARRAALGHRDPYRRDAAADLVGGVFVAETLSVILQVTYFKLSGGKRIFRMSPLHHHFELGGWPETKVTSRFWVASAGPVARRLGDRTMTSRV